MRSRAASIWTALAVVGVVPLLAAWTAQAALVLDPAASRLTVRGTSTVRSFECRAKTLDLTVTTAAAGAAQSVLAGQKAVQAVQLTVPAAELDCANGTMNEHMLKAVKAAQHPTIQFRLASYDVAAAGSGARGTLTGTLTLGGVTKTIAIPATAKPAPGGALRVEGTHELKLSDYGLKAPTLMMGTMKVGDAVTVAFDLALKE